MRHRGGGGGREWGSAGRNAEFHAPRLRHEGPTRTNPLTFQQGADFCEGVYGSQTGVLTHSILHKEQGDPTQKQHDEVRQEEGTWNRRGRGLAFPTQHRLFKRFCIHIGQYTKVAG